MSSSWYRRSKNNEILPKRKSSVKPLKKKSDQKPHKKGHSEYHCLDDVCILVKVPSGSTYMSKLSSIESNKVTDATLEAYAKKAEEKANAINEGLSASSTSTSSTPSTDENGYNNDNENNGENDDDSGSSLSDRDLIMADCSEFLDPISFAKDFVQKVVSESEARIPASIPEINGENEDEESFTMGGFKESLDYAIIDTKRSFTCWPTIDTFNIETGAYKIDEYLSSFDTEEDWMYVIYYQGMQDTPCSDLYKYQAIYSLPTWKYPIAQATASIYFTIEVCKIKPSQCTVDVTYKYETYSHNRKPGIHDFDEKWLHFILDSKIKFFKTVTY